ncbi:MAG: DUF2141 domain-containing protein [Bacteroidia bacterium]
MRIILPLFLFISLTMSVLIGKTPQQSQLTIEFYGLRNSKGQICVLLYNSPKGYYKDKKAAYKSLLVPIKNQKATCIIPNLPEGDYAVVAIHDENFNQEMNTNLVGMPSEGVAVSNNAVSWWTPKDFSIAKINLNTNKSISLKMNY